MSSTSLAEYRPKQLIQLGSEMTRWDAYYLKLAVATAQMSRDPSTKVGAIIVGPDADIRATGFNGFPRGVADYPHRLQNRQLKYKMIVHAEMNAIFNAARAGISLQGCRLYLIAMNDAGCFWGGPPCSNCIGGVIQSGITEIVSLPPSPWLPDRWLESLNLSLDMIEEAGLWYREVLTPRSTARTVLNGTGY